MANPLDPVIVWYTTARDGLRVTKRVLTKDIEGAITDKHVFHAAEKPNNLARLEAARVELGRMVVIALVAIFERVLRDHLAGLSRAMIHPGDALREAVQSEVSKDIEFASQRASSISSLASPERFAERYDRFSSFATGSRTDTPSHSPSRR